MTLVGSLKIDLKPAQDYEKEKLQKLKKVVKKHAFIIEAESKDKAPYKTGFLKSTLQAKKEDSDGLSWSVSDNTNYGVYQELGTAKIPAKHFLGNACESDAEDFFDDVKEALE